MKWVKACWCSNKKLSPKISKIHSKTLALKSHFIKAAALYPVTLLKKRSRPSCFPVNFAKLFRTSFLQKNIQKEPPEMFYKKIVVKNFAIFLVKYRPATFSVDIEKLLRTPILKNNGEELFLTIVLLLMLTQ